MQVQQFLERLPGLYEGWGTGEMAPKAGEFGEILGSSAQPTTANFLALARWAAACLEPGEAIAEIGCYEGANLAAMLRDEPELLAYGVDFFSTQPEVAEERLGRLQENLDRFGVLERVCVAHQTVEDFFRELADLGAEDRFGLYLYGFEPDYRQVFLSLLLGRRFWAESALVIVRNTELGGTRRAIADFLELEPSFRLLLDWRGRGRQVFGAEGLGIFAWDTLGALADWEPLRVEELSPPIQLVTPAPEGKKRVLHVGCGPYNPEALPRELRTEEWQEIRLDINPAVNPDILGTITDLGAVPDNSVDAVYSSHNIEHIYTHEVPRALAEFRRVLREGGKVVITCPDIQAVAAEVAQGNLENTLYVSPAGPIAAIDILYGLGTDLARGNDYMAHKTAFTAETLKGKLEKTGFSEVEVRREGLNLWAYGYVRSANVIESGAKKLETPILLKSI